MVWKVWREATWYGFIQNVIDKNENSDKKKQFSELELDREILQSTNSIGEGNLKLIEVLKELRELLGSWEAVERFSSYSTHLDALHIIDSLKKKEAKDAKSMIHTIHKDDEDCG